MVLGDGIATLALPEHGYGRAGSLEWTQYQDGTLCCFMVSECRYNVVAIVPSWVGKSFKFVWTTRVGQTMDRVVGDQMVGDQMVGDQSTHRPRVNLRSSHVFPIRGVAVVNHA